MTSTSQRASAVRLRLFPASERRMPTPSRCSRLTSTVWLITGCYQHCPPELLQPLLSTKLMSLSQLKRSQRSWVKSQSTQSILRRSNPPKGHLLEFMVGPYTYSPLNNSYPVKEAQVGGESKIESSLDRRGVGGGLFIARAANAQIEANSDIWIYTDFPHLFLLTSRKAQRPKIPQSQS